jgi:hypothetical protein
MTSNTAIHSSLAATCRQVSLTNRKNRPHAAVSWAQRMTLVLPAIGAVFFAGSATVHAQTWQNADLFQGAPGLSASATDIGTATDGSTLFSVGWTALDAAGNSTAIVRKSANSGLTWTTVDNYTEPSWSSAGYRGFGAGVDGSLFACGELWDGATQSKIWMVRQGAADGTSWATVDAYQAVPDAWASCGDVKVNPYTGDVYAVGNGNTGGGNTTPFNWVVRKRAAGAANFTTVDVVPATPFGDARAVAFHPTAGVLVVGRLGDGASQRWTVRRSPTGQPGTWTTVDAFQEAPGAYSWARGIAVNPSGVIYVCGKAIQPLKKGPVKTVNNWVVRRSLNGGTTWTTVDQFGAEPAPFGAGNTTAVAITLSPSGKVFVTGNSAAPARHLVRKGTTAPNGTMTWVTSDDFQLVSGQNSEGQGITSDAAGNIFSAGLGEVDSTGLSYFLTRKLAGPQ